ncbi:hypothetical protein PVAND_005333 [Polypedilum vanderplanki]|uniref:BTB domain-containing protein n=1 Tax=Polypedilum vanderplanki TaxID=319348 RepID=A0A9J6BZV2_POLVA|nr:hypothetical protein PVAND_005333 [Polypedilum vanderplanki]
MEVKMFDFTGNVQSKQCFKDKFGNNWFIFINEIKSNYSIIPSSNRSWNPTITNHNRIVINQAHDNNKETFVYYGNIILKPINEAILQKVEEIKILMKMQNGSSNFSIIPKHQHGGVFSFCLNQQYSRLVKYDLHVEFPDFKKDDLNSSKEYLKKLLETGEYSDVVIKTKSKDINVHKMILSRYEYYDRMFKNKTKEAQTGVIDSGHDYKMMVELMKYIYYEKCNLNDFALDLLVLADQYNISNLFSICEKFLINDITIENFFDITKVIEQITKAVNLRKSIIKFFADNQIKIITTDQWNEFKKDEVHYKTAMNLMEAHAHYIHEGSQNENSNKRAKLSS